MYENATMLCLFEACLEGDSLHLARLADSTFCFLLDINDKLDVQHAINLGCKTQ